MHISIEGAEQEMKVLSKKMAKLSEYQARYNDLQAFVELGNKLSSSGNGSSKIAAVKETTASVIKRVLSKRGPLTSGELLDAMLKEGWATRGNRSKDYNAMYTPLKRKQDLFELGPDNRWNCARKKETQASE